jgi:hypothetical protein
MKIWKPDTCGCEIEEVYNGTEITGGGAVLHKCTAHTAVADNELYGVLYANPDGENKRKNEIYRILIGEGGVEGLGLEETVTDERGQQSRRLKPGVEYSWSYQNTGKNRVLRVEIRGATLTTAQKNAIRNAAVSRFGAGKVDVV